MGKGKYRESTRDRPPDGMLNASGQHITDLARSVMNLLEKPFAEGMQADLAAQVLVVAAVDLWRANYGDVQAAAALKRAIERRMEKPFEYWGGERAAIRRAS